jgi:hypothetical protein
MKETGLTGIVAEHIDAINAGDTDRTFAEDAYVNDNHREFVGIDAIRRWVTNEVAGAIVRMPLTYRSE